MKTYNDVLAFQYKFGVLSQRGHPHFPTQDVLDFRIKFLQEELDEYKKAVDERNLPKAIDALIDLTYVINGTALLMGISPACWEDCWDVVQQKNMEKVRASDANDPRSKRGHSLDVVKPVGWTPPDLLPILQWFGYKGEE